MTFDDRIGRVEDAPAMAELLARFGREREEAVRACERVLQEPFGFSLVVFADGAQKRLVGFENALLIHPDLAAKAIEEGVPLSRIFERSKGRFGLAEVELGALNAGSGSEMWVTHFKIDPHLSPEDYGHVLSRLGLAFVDRFAGNRVRSVLHEVEGLENAQRAEPGGYRVADVFRQWHVAQGGEEIRRPILIRGELVPALHHHNLPVVRFLTYHEPILRFPPAAREILRLAHLGHSDAQILVELGLSVASLNSRWTRILDLAERKMPELFGRRSCGRARDRHSLLLYIEKHPEELWPYEIGKSA